MFTRIGDTTRKYLEQFRGGRFCPAAPIVFVEMTVEHTGHVLGATAFAAPIVHYDVPASHRVGGRRCSAGLSLSSRRLLAGATFR
jgi:hypothetical protein